MSMVHDSYFLDWQRYTHELLNDNWPDPDQPSDWREILPNIKRHLRNVASSNLPDWKGELLESDLEDNQAAIESDQPSQRIETIRNLNYLALLSCTVDHALGYHYHWDILKEGLRSLIGEQSGDELVLGVYWGGKAWDFPPDLVTYQYGVVLPDMIARHRRLAETVNAKTLASKLREVDWSRNYPIYAQKISDEDVAQTLHVLACLQSNLKHAEEQQCSILYLLN